MNAVNVDNWDQEYAECIYGLSTLYARMGQIEKQKATLEKLLDFNPTNINGLKDIINIYAAKRETMNKALPLFDRLIKLEPEVTKNSNILEVMNMIKQGKFPGDP